MVYPTGYSIPSDTTPYPGMVWVGSDTIPFFWYGHDVRLKLYRMDEVISPEISGTLVLAI